MRCFKRCADLDVKCPIKDCRLWIDYGEDLNCTVIAIDKNSKMGLRDVGDRLGISFVRVKQIEDKLVKKIGKRLLLQKNDYLKDDV